MAKCFKLTAPKDMGKVPKGFVLQVPSRCSTPSNDEIKAALINAGFGDRDSLAYRASGNWKVEKMQ